jgi:hypothetical protein
MTRIIRTLVCCVLLSAAYTAPAAVLWDGGSAFTNNWSDDINWIGNVEPTTNADVTIADQTPRATCNYDSSALAGSFGLFVFGDSMTFNVNYDPGTDLNFTDMSLSGSATVAGSQPWNVDTLTIDADTPSAARVLTKNGNNTFSISGDTSLIADANAANNATLVLNAGSIAYQDLVLDGGDKAQASYGQALFDYNAGTVAALADLVMSGDSKVDAEESFTMTGELDVDAGGYATDAVINMASSKTLTADRLVVGNASYATKLTFTGPGTVTTN